MLGLGEALEADHIAVVHIDAFFDQQLLGDDLDQLEAG